MAEATQMVTGLPTALSVPLYGASMVLLLMWSSYRTIARGFNAVRLLFTTAVINGLLAPPLILIVLPLDGSRW